MACQIWIFLHVNWKESEPAGPRVFRGSLCFAAEGSLAGGAEGRGGGGAGSACHPQNEGMSGRGPSRWGRGIPFQKQEGLGRGGRALRGPPWLPEGPDLTFHWPRFSSSKRPAEPAELCRKVLTNRWPSHVLAAISYGRFTTGKKKENGSESNQFFFSFFKVRQPFKYHLK